MPAQPASAPLSTDDALRASQQHIGLLVQSVKDYAIFMVTPEGLVATWNAGAEAIKGYRAEEIIGRPISAFYSEQDVASGRWLRLLRLAAEHGRSEEEGWRLRKDGTRFWADVVVTALRDESGELIGFAKVTRDLTERRRAEEELRQSEERFRLLVDSVQDYAIFMLDTGGRVVTWNAGAERIKGYQAVEIVGRHFSSFYPPEEIDAGKPARELSTAIETGRYEEEGWRVRKDGTHFWASVVLTAILDASGRHVGFAKVTRDLTERKKLETEQLRRAQAEEALRLRDEFLSIASHELKTPLTALSLQLEALRDRLVSIDEKVARRLDRASKSSDRLTELVETLLDVSRVASGKLQITPEKLDLAAAVVEAVEGMRDAAAKAECELSVRIEPGLEGKWDRLRIEQVVTNLLSNAIRYAAGKPIEVSLVREGDEARLHVRDGGPGIAEADRERIFGRFQRASSMRNYGGLGLGLYVAREIVEAHGGSIAVENAPAGGAVFHVSLPLGAARQQAGEPHRCTS